MKRHLSSLLAGFFGTLFMSPLVYSDILKSLIIDQAYQIQIFASELDSPRQLAESPAGRIFVGSRTGGSIFAIRDTDNNGVSDERVLVADGLTLATGVSIFDGDLFFSEINKIWKIANIDQVLDKNPLALPNKQLITDNLPSGGDDQFDSTDLIALNTLAVTCATNGIRCCVFGLGVNATYTPPGGSAIYPWRIFAADTGGQHNQSYDSSQIIGDIQKSCL